MDYQATLIAKIFKSTGATPSKGLSSVAQNALDVYHNNYIENGIRALSIGFPSLAAILDEQDLRKLFHTYLLDKPKSCFDWADYGHDLEEYILSIEALSALPFLSELAKLDWHLMQAEREPSKAFDAASFALLQTQPANELRFLAGNGLRMFTAIFPLVELYQLAHDEALQTDETARKLHLKKINNLIDDAIKHGRPRSIIVWRAEYKAEFDYLQDVDAKAFEKLNHNEDIENVLSVFGDDQVAMSTWLQSTIQSKRVLAIEAL